MPSRKTNMLRRGEIMEKKGAEIAISTIIIAGIALLVLIIIIVIFSGKINIFGKGYSQTQIEATQKVCATYKQFDTDTTSKSCRSMADCTSVGGSPVGTNIDFIDCGKDEICCAK